MHDKSEANFYNGCHLYVTTFAIAFLERFCPTRWIEDKPVTERGIAICENFVKLALHWEGLCKSSRPLVKSYEVLVNHYRDSLMPIKMQFSSFIASILRPSHDLSDE